MELTMKEIKNWGKHIFKYRYLGKYILHLKSTIFMLKNAYKPNNKLEEKESSDICLKHGIHYYS